jgi:hypothetical protein
MYSNVPQSITAVKRIIIKYSLYAAATYVVYFLLMRVLGLAPYIKLRFLNYFLYFIVGFYALKALAISKKGELNYLQGLGVSYAIGALSFTIYGAIIFLYSYFDSFFMDTLFTEYRTAAIYGRFAPSFAVSTEGIGLCTIVSFCLMQYFKIFSERKERISFSTKNDPQNAVAGNPVDDQIQKDIGSFRRQ